MPCLTDGERVRSTKAFTPNLSTRLSQKLYCGCTGSAGNKSAKKFRLFGHVSFVFCLVFLDVFNNISLRINDTKIFLDELSLQQESLSIIKYIILQKLPRCPTQISNLHMAQNKQSSFFQLVDKADKLTGGPGVCHHQQDLWPPELHMILTGV